MRIFIFKQNRQIIFKFEDKGIGIESSEKENVFRKFYRIQSEYNQQGSVGLGLAFCKEVVKLMNGDISVESKKGVGSVFTIILPYEFPN
jgi:two-component system phosphate regulon sensor histidine kinase PhoR